MSAAAAAPAEQSPIVISEQRHDRLSWRLNLAMRAYLRRVAGVDILADQRWRPYAIAWLRRADHLRRCTVYRRIYRDLPPFNTSATFAGWRS